MPFDKEKIRFCYYSGKYNPPHESPPLLKTIGYVFIISIFFFGLDIFFGTKFFATEGPLSSSHAVIENDCSACHSSNWTRSNVVMQERCMKCHTDIKRLKFHVETHRRTKKDQRKISERYCADCHKEHRGRDSRPSVISDNHCRNCHDIHDPKNDHPKFVSDKLEVATQEKIGLKFSHAAHRVNEKRAGKTNKELEKGCPLCHQLDPATGFYNFKRTNFEKDCQSCHPLKKLSIKKMFVKKDKKKEEGKTELAKLMDSINKLNEKLEFGSTDTFLSRFEYITPRRRGQRVGFNYSPVHKDPYLKVLFVNEELPEEEVKKMLDLKRGATFSCLKCHVMVVGPETKQDHLQISKNAAFMPVLSETNNTVITKISHKAHYGLGCDSCHKNIMESKSLTDKNVTISRKFCFNCHNNTMVKNECTMCHGFHKAIDQVVLSKMVVMKNGTPP